MIRLFTIYLLCLYSTYASAEDTKLDAFAEIIDTKGKKIGTAEFYQGVDGILIKLEVKGLKSGYHGLHFHEVGDCSDHAEGFKKSGAHLHTENREHGLLSPVGPHAGDIPNIYVHSNGVGKTDIYTEMASLNGRDFKPELLDSDGASIIIHENADDYISQPSGNSGNRVACGEIRTAN